MTAGGKIGRMAVIKAWRGRGVGTALLKELLTEARARGLTHVLLDARVQALPFYEKHGFRAEGEIFLDAGLPHLNMTLRLLT
jgi:predicted GNAT family N-acyltransferase